MGKSARTKAATKMTKMMATIRKRTAANFQSGLRQPNPRQHLRPQRHDGYQDEDPCTGSFIGKDVIARSKTWFHHLNGWEIPGVIYDPASTVATKIALAQSGDEGADESDSGSEFGLDQNYPTPFNTATTIRYTLAEPTEVKLVIYNILGQEVKVLVNST